MRVACDRFVRATTAPISVSVWIPIGLLSAVSVGNGNNPQEQGRCVMTHMAVFGLANDRERVTFEANKSVALTAALGLCAIVVLGIFFWPNPLWQALAG